MAPSCRSAHVLSVHQIELPRCGSGCAVRIVLYIRPQSEDALTTSMSMSDGGISTCSIGTILIATSGHGEARKGSAEIAEENYVSADLATNQQQSFSVT
jgi:hypothetical protein